MTDMTPIRSEKEESGWMSHFDKFRKNSISRFAKFIPNIMSDIPEQEKLIILIDIVGFSKSTTREQVYTIYVFQQYLISHIISSSITFRSKININQFVPTGDGCYIVADKCDPRPALEFLIALVSGFRSVGESDGDGLSLRVSALLGSCVPFMDMAHHRNFVGVGMNEAARILTGGQSVLEQSFMSLHPDADISEAKHFSRNSIFLGDSIACAADIFADKCSYIYKFGDVADKHGITRNITVMQDILQR